MRKKLLILPIIAIVVAVFSTTVLAVSGSQQNWVKIYSGSTDVTNEFDINQTSFSAAFAFQDDMDSICDGVSGKIKNLDKNLTVKDFKGIIGYDIEPKAGYTVSGSYKVVVQNAVADNEIYIFVHVNDSDTTPYEYSIAKGGQPTVTVDNFSPFYVFTAASKTSPQTGDFAPAYIAMVGVALVSCGAIFAIRAKKATKVSK